MADQQTEPTVEQLLGSDGVTAHLDRADDVAEKSALSLRDTILAADDERSEMVDVPEWGVTLQVRSMTGEERARVLSRYMDQDTGNLDIETMTPEILIATCFDPASGERVFQPTDVALLNKKSAGPLERLGSVALRLSGLDKAGREAAGKG